MKVISTCKHYMIVVRVYGEYVCVGSGYEWSFAFSYNQMQRDEAMVKRFSLTIVSTFRIIIRRTSRDAFQQEGITVCKLPLTNVVFKIKQGVF